MTHEAREQRTNQQSKSKEAQKNHQAITVAIRRHRVSAPRRDAARDTLIRPIAIRILRGSIARMEDKIFTRARQHRYKNIIESRGDSTILFYSLSVPWTSLLNLRSLLIIQARREATRTKPPIFSRDDAVESIQKLHRTYFEKKMDYELGFLCPSFTLVAGFYCRLFPVIFGNAMAQIIIRKCPIFQTYCVTREIYKPMPDHEGV